MGMSASQVRFLSLQSRKNDVSRQLMSLSNRKMSLSRDMNKVSQHYTDALNQKLLKWSNDSGATYNQLTYDLMMKPNDLNTETPYIVTNATNGKVILNNDELTDSEGNGLGISYVDIAKMISSYQGIDTNNNIVYDTTKESYDITRNGQTITVGDKAIDGAYFIPDSTKDFSFDNCLRYEIFMKLGLISEEEVNQQKSMLIQLYGSEEAQKTGIYPVGSAWGDYYIAQANLEAYEDFLENKQNISSANSYNNSKNENANLNDYSESYNYNAQVDGVNGYSNITQTSTGSGAISHINFSEVVTQDTDGLYSKKDSASVGSSFYDNYNYSTLGDNSITYGMTVSQTGVKYTYGIDDLYNNALSNYKEWNGTTGADYTNYISVLETSINSGSNNSGQGLICLYDKMNDYDFTESRKNTCLSRIGGILDAFVNLMSCATVTTMSADALQKAKNQTLELYKSDYTDSHCSADSSEGTPNSRAKENAVGNNRMSVAWKKFCFYPWKVNRARLSVYVDTKPLFDTFMTYYNYYLQNPDKGSVTTTISSDSTVATEDTSTSSPSATNTVKTYNGQKVYFSSYTGSDGYTYTSRTNLSTSSYGSSSDIIYVNSSNNISENYALGYTQYFTDNANTENLQDKGGATFSYTAVDGNTYSVYGVVTGNSTYILTTSSALSEYKSGKPVTSISGATEITNTASPATGFGDLIFKDVDDNYSVTINTTQAASYYDIRVFDEVTEDETYHQYLRDKVQDALDYINELQNDLSTFYGAKEQKLMDYYDALFMRIAENGWEIDESTSADKTTSTEYLNNKLQNNDYFVTVCQQKADETGYNYTAKMATSVMKIYEVNDDSAQNQALAKYESDKTLISNKEAKIDAMMQKLETEQEAINTEMESVQKIVSENIDKTFKIFA